MLQNVLKTIADDVNIGKGAKLSPYIVLYGCSIGNNTKIGPFVEIQKEASVGNNCKIQSHTFICEGVSIEDNVFVGHGVTFINDRYPRSTNPNGSMQTEADWKKELTTIKQGASIGSGATIMCGISVGEGAIIGAGSMVTKDVPPFTIVKGNPAQIIRKINE